jgi:diaminopimelate epimerase
VTFEKYCASGNDFLITHTFVRKDFSKLAKKLCDRHYGFGADGLIVLIPSKTADFEWLFYNSDGSIPAMCGNGARAAALYARDNGLAGKTMSFVTNAGVIKAEVFAKNIVETQLTPIKTINEQILEYELQWMLIDTGVPHLCTYVNNVDKFDIEAARVLRHKYNANINIFTKKDDAIHVRTYERGVENETLACGTGMCACAYMAQKLKLIDKNSCVVYPLSKERIEVSINGAIPYFKGLVEHIGSCLQKA